MDYKPLNRAIAEATTLTPTGRNVPPGGLTFTLQFHHPDDTGYAKRIRTAEVHLDHATASQYINQAQPTYDTLFDQWFSGGGEQYGEGGSEEAVIVAVNVVTRGERDG